MDYLQIVTTNSLIYISGLVFFSFFSKFVIGGFKVRRNFIYFVSIGILILVLIRQILEHTYDSVPIICLCLGILHSFVHQMIPFISEKGLDPTFTGFVDVYVHFIMHLFVCYISLNQINWSMTNYMLGFVTLGSYINALISIYFPVNNIWFINTSIFQALSSGGWVGALLSYNHYQYENYDSINLSNIIIWISFIVGAINWLVFRNSNNILTKLYSLNYFDVFFIFPTWIFVYYQL